MRNLRDYALLILGRVILAGSGYVVLAYSANQLQPAVFAELAFYQTLQFLAAVAFDSGTVQAATRRAGGARDWALIAKEYQSIRALFHVAVAALLFTLTSLRAPHVSDPFLPLACTLAFLSNLLNADWLLTAVGLR